jgi:iron complex transport system permease protein
MEQPSIFKNKAGFSVKKSAISITFILLFILAITVIIALTTGPARLGFNKVFQILINSLPWFKDTAKIDTIDQKIVFDIRLPRIILAVIVGASLGIAGVIFQSLFRNPMADPSVIGTSSGAALGATLAIATGLDFNIMNISPVPITAFAGAFLVTLLVYYLAKIGNRIPMTFLLLAGIAVSTFLSSVISLIMILRRTEMYNIVSWLMGGFASRRWIDVVIILPYTLIGFLITMSFCRELNLMLLGEERAGQLGLNSNRLQKLMIISASLLVAGAVSVSGIIGFVGLLVPHIVRLFVGPDHKYLLPVSALAGGTFLLAADTIARNLMAPLELPVGIVTALFGAPFFIYLLRKNKRAGETLK